MSAHSPEFAFLWDQLRILFRVLRYAVSGYHTNHFIVSLNISVILSC
jgi:hypothetical protein